MPDSRVAPYQARLERAPSGLYAITDLTHQGGVAINGLAVQQARIVPGAEVAIGPYCYILTGDELHPCDRRNSIQIDRERL
jgi:hypothetical protein